MPNPAPGAKLPGDLLKQVPIVTLNETKASPFEYPYRKVLWPLRKGIVVCYP